MADHPGRELRPRRQAQLVQNVAHVDVRGALRDDQHACDLSVGQAARDQDDDLSLARRQQRHLSVGGAGLVRSGCWSATVRGSSW